MKPSDETPDPHLRESWNINADAWTDAVREGRIESRRLVTNAALIEVIAAGQPGRLLDVGCGEGWLARELSPRGFEVVGVDASEPLIDAARQLGGGTFHVMSYDELAAGSTALEGSFDYVVCNFSLLSEGLGSVLRSLSTQLAQGGSLVVQTVHPFTAAAEGPYENGWREEDFSRLGVPFPAAMPWFYRTMGSWIRELLEAGLELTDCREPLNPRTSLPASLILISGQGGA